MKRSGKREIREQRILKVLQEFLAARIALDLLERELAADPNFLDREGLRQRVAVDLRNNLEATYLVRIFAEFEAGLRDVWEIGWNRMRASDEIVDRRHHREAINRPPYTWACSPCPSV